MLNQDGTRYPASTSDDRIVLALLLNLYRCLGHTHRHDIIGALFCILGVLIMFYAPRTPN